VGKIFNRIYTRWENPGLLLIAQQRGLQFDWIIEAGCHDGSDTLKFLELQNVLKVYAFEPDIRAADKAEKRYHAYGGKVSFSRLALMDKPGYIQLSSPTGNFGDGTTTIQSYYEELPSFTSIGDLIPCSTLDFQLLNSQKGMRGRGLMWLDVEGSAAKVLAGASRVLEFVDLIQVEVDLHDSTHRRGNFQEVNDYLKGKNFAIIYGPIHPGFFGDAIYIRKTELSFTGRRRSEFLGFLMRVTHRLIYPLLQIPKR
jgi:FkbM family methyltransferase